MDTLSYKTKSANAATVNKKWLVVDASGESLGRLASTVALMLRGKHKPDYTPHVDCGDNVIVINAKNVRLTGAKWTAREHFSHTGYPGGQKITTPEDLYKKSPARLVEHAVRGMLPKNRLGRQLFRNLYVYIDAEHKHEAQKPEIIELNVIK